MKRLNTQPPGYLIVHFNDSLEFLLCFKVDSLLATTVGEGNKSVLNKSKLLFGAKFVSDTTNTRQTSQFLWKLLNKNKL